MYIMRLYFFSYYFMPSWTSEGDLKEVFHYLHYQGKVKYAYVLVNQKLPVYLFIFKSHHFGATILEGLWQVACMFLGFQVPGISYRQASHLLNPESSLN